MVTLLIIWFLLFFLLSLFRLVFLPITLASLPPRVMLLNHSTTPRDSATNIEKASQKGAPERERPNRSVVKIEVIWNYSSQNSTKWRNFENVFFMYQQNCEETMKKFEEKTLKEYRKYSEKYFWKTSAEILWNFRD